MRNQSLFTEQLNFIFFNPLTGTEKLFPFTKRNNLSQTLSKRCISMEEHAAWL